MRIALLVSPESFEGFYREMLGLEHSDFVDEYRNDFAWDYASALRARGIETVIYVPSHEQDGPREAADGHTVRFLQLGRVARLCPPVFRHAISPLERYAAEIVNAVSMLPRLRKALVEDRVDLLYVQEYWTGRFDLLSYRSPVPVVAGEHGGSEGRHLHLLKRRTLNRAAAITAQSTAEQKRLHRRYGVDAQLIPNGVDTDFYTPPAQGEQREPVVLVVARLHNAQKRISDLLRAVSLLDSQWRLELVGRGPDKEDLQRLAEELGIADRVTFVGFVREAEELRGHYRRCGAFAMPSRWEAMTIALLEAMSCGAPPVVTPLRPFADLIEAGVNGMVVEHDDPAGLAAGIEAAYADRDRIGAAARETVSTRYGQSVTMGALASLLREAAGNSRYWPADDPI